MGPFFTSICLVICDGMLDVLDFILLSAGCFCIPYLNIRVLCSGTGLSYLEIVLCGACFEALLVGARSAFG